MKSNNQRGIISFLAVIFISMLLIVITTGFVRIMLNDERQSSDYDLSARAFYIAEQGVEDAVTKIDSGTVVLDSCEDASILSTEPETPEVTCQYVSQDNITAQDSLAPGESAVISLKDADPSLSYIEIRWHTEPFSSGALTAYGTNPSPSNRPAAIKASAVSYPTTSFGSSNIVRRTFSLWPSSSSFSSNSVSGSSNDQALETTSNCSGTNFSNYGFYCRARLTGFNVSARDYVLNMKLFNTNVSTNFEVLGYDASDDQVSINTNVYQIDATGRAGDVFRRVLATYNSGDEPVVAKNFGYDYVIYSDTDVCKDLRIERYYTGELREASVEDPGC